jgi:hypothetical protein
MKLEAAPGICDAFNIHLVPRSGNPVSNSDMVGFCTLQCSLEPFDGLLMNELLEGLVDTLVQHLKARCVSCRYEVNLYSSPLCCHDIFLLEMD